jgi:NAD(P)-dependent dehydrogenase (short-subunit alcohol dehydrogenase family)
MRWRNSLRPFAFGVEAFGVQELATGRCFAGSPAMADSPSKEPVLRSQRSGHVIQMSSIFGEMSFPATGMLAAVRQALGGATQAMSAELAPLGIRFTQVEPGGIRTEFLAKWHVAEHVIVDYDDTAGATLNGLRNLPREAIADVSSVAAAILKIAGAEQPPMRLALGGWAEGIIRKEIADRSADLDNWSHLTRSIDNC